LKDQLIKDKAAEQEEHRRKKVAREKLINVNATLEK
jgi:hypothetical protein